MQPYRYRELDAGLAGGITVGAAAPGRDLTPTPGPHIPTNQGSGCVEDRSGQQSAARRSRRRHVGDPWDVLMSNVRTMPMLIALVVVVVLVIIVLTAGGVGIGCFLAGVLLDRLLLGLVHRS